MADFHGKTVLVTGGSRGIGAAVARRFASAGARLAIGSRSAGPEAEELARALRAEGAEVHLVSGDIADPAAAAAMVRTAYAALGQLDILVNAAGIGPYVPLAGISPDHVRSVMDTNVGGTIFLTQAAAAVMTAPGGRIIHFSSRLAQNPLPTSSVYSASKAAVNTLVHAFARELGPRGITVNAVAPGVIETDMTRQIIVERGAQIAAATPLGRIGQPGDITGVVAFLASADAGWITGRTLIADGGLN